jgi:hypothetical protein
MQHVGELLASSDPAKIDRAISMAARSKGIQAYLRPFASNVAAGAIAADAQRRKADQPPPVPTQRPVLTVTRRAGEENARQ